MHDLHPAARKQAGQQSLETPLAGGNLGSGGARAASGRPWRAKLVDERGEPRLDVTRRDLHCVRAEA